MGEEMVATLACVICVLIAALVIRIVIGPTAFDRLLAFNAINTLAILLLLLIGTGFGRLEVFIDIAIAYTILSLVGSIAAVKYLRQFDHAK